MRTTLYGEKCGAALAVVPGAVIAMAVCLLSFSFMDHPLIRMPVTFVVVAGVVVFIGAALGAGVGGLVEAFRPKVVMRTSERKHR